MKVFNSKLAAIGLAAFVFASCSDSNSDPTDGSKINVVDRTTITLASQNVDNSRVVNYKNSTAKARKFFLNTRAGSSIFPAFKDAPKEENAKPLNKVADLTNKNYAITGNKSLNFAGKTIDGATIFVHGGSTFEYDNTTKMTNTTIVLLSSATLKYTGTGEMIAQGNTVFCTDAKNKFVATGDININGELYANFKGTSSQGKDLTTGLGAIKETTAAEKAKSITPTQKITFGAHANAYIKGSIRATELNIENGASIYTTSNIFNNGTVNIKSQLGIEGFLKAQNLNVDGYLEAGKNSAIKVLGTMNVNDGAYISANYINVTNNTKKEDGKINVGNATLNLNGNCTIHLSNKNVINVNNLVTDNSNQGQIELAEDNAVAVIKADKFENNGNERILSFKTSGNNSCFLFQFTKCFNGSTELNTFEDLAIQATYIDYDKTTQNDMVDYKDENNKHYGYEWKGDASLLVASKKLDLIASSEDPSDGQSATCIQPANGLLYVSYHTNGNDVAGGNIEVARMTEGNKKLTIEQSKKADRIDYNHLIVDGSKLYLAGSQQGNGSAEGTAVGAFMGEIELTGSGISDNMVLNAVDKKNSKIDANCVAALGTDHVLATTKGFYVFDKDGSFDIYGGSSVGKHVVTVNNKIYALTEDGTLNVYNSSNMETAEKTYQVGAVEPKGNKAVVAVDNNGDIYVCKGENGVAKISGGTVNQNFFTCPTISAGGKAGQVKGCANGVATDGQYVYIACGSYGVVVLDKTTGKEVCHRKASNGKSANYVAVDNGNIYVAYGQSRIQVYTITQTK